MAYLGNQRSTDTLAVANSAALAVCTLMSGATAFLWLAAANLGAQLVRRRVSKAFGALDPNALSADDVRVWESRTLLLGGGLTLVFGFACMIAFTSVDDELTRNFVIMLTTANALGVVARSFGLVRLVRVQLALLCVPLAAGLVLYDSAWATLLAAFVVPFAFVTDSLAGKLRAELTDAVTDRAAAAELAGRFSSTLAVVPEALVHLDAEGRIAVVNRAARRLFGIDRHVVGQELGEIVTSSPAFGGEDRYRLVRIAAGMSAPATLTGADGRRHAVRTVSAEADTLLIVTDVTERERAERELVRMARTDAITGLSSRGWLQDCGRRVMEGSEPVALALVDIDGFKAINDTFGQRRGDEVLRRMARFLDEGLPDGMIAARLGADEFAVLAAGSCAIEGACGLDEACAANLGDRIGALLERFAEGDDGSGLSLSATAGIAESIAGEEMDALIARAGIAMRAAKDARSAAQRDGGTAPPRVRLFDAELHRRHEERLAIKAALARDLPTGAGFALAYQPIVNPRRGVIVAAEALCRWSSEGHGPVRPNIFIGLAEELGMIRTLTDLVLGRATLACASWGNDARVSVNLAAADLRDDELPQRVRAALDNAKLDGRRLQLEITEGHVIRDDAATLRTLAALRRMGVGIALDDFGTGYSNLATVERLPLDTVKLDRSLVTRIDEDRPLGFLTGAIDLFHRLGLRVVVEGIETEEQIVRLGTIDGEALVQGFVFGRPMAEPLMLDLMRRSGTRHRKRRNISVETVRVTKRMRTQP